MICKVDGLDISVSMTPCSIFADNLSTERSIAERQSGYRLEMPMSRLIKTKTTRPFLPFDCICASLSLAFEF